MSKSFRGVGTVRKTGGEFMYESDKKSENGGEVC